MKILSDYIKESRENTSVDSLSEHTFDIAAMYKFINNIQMIGEQ